jgi:membrane protease YdiL (CAAX protease family)
MTQLASDQRNIPVPWSVGEVLCGLGLAYAVHITNRFLTPRLLEPLLTLATTPHTWLNDFFSASLPPRYLLSIFLHAAPVLPYVFVVALVVWYLVFRSHKGSWPSLRLQRTHAVAHLALGAVVAAAMVVTFRVLGSMATGDSFLIPEPSRPTAFAIVSDALFHSLPLAIAHQLLLGGLMYQALRRRLPVSISSFITALLFAAWYFPSESFVRRVPGGLITGFISVLLLEKRKSLIPGISFYTVYNVLRGAL